MPLVTAANQNLLAIIDYSNCRLCAAPEFARGCIVLLGPSFTQHRRNHGDTSNLWNNLKRNPPNDTNKGWPARRQGHGAWPSSCKKEMSVLVSARGPCPYLPSCHAPTTRKGRPTRPDSLHLKDQISSSLVPKCCVWTDSGYCNNKAIGHTTLVCGHDTTTDQSLNALRPY